jgi:hypothetical protein
MIDAAAAPRCTAFHGQHLLAAGELPDILPTLKRAYERDSASPMRVFEDRTGRLIDLDLRGSVDEALRRAAARGTPAAVDETRVVDDPGSLPARRPAGRPRLGVVSREVTLLPRHWEWLNGQPGGASVALRRLVDEARKLQGGRDRVRHAQEVAYAFLLAMGGDLPGYEEILRALFAGKQDRFEALLASWPADIRNHALRLAAEAFPADPQAVAAPDGVDRVDGVPR